MQIPEIPTGTQIFILALSLTFFVGTYMVFNPEELNLCLTFMGGIYTGFLASSLDLTKIIKPKEGES